MRYRAICAVLLAVCSISDVSAQRRVDPPPFQRPTIATSPLATTKRVDARNTHERLIALVPMIGTGTLADPRRPAFTPAPRKKGEQLPRTGIIAYSYVMADDGQHAIVEFVAMDRAAFASILADRSPDIKSFQKGKEKRDDVELELKKYKKDLDLDRLGVRLP